MGPPFTGALILALLAIYIFVLFAVAWRADRRDVPKESPQRRAVVYSLSIAVYFALGLIMASRHRERTGWQYLPIYLGPILAITLFFPVMASYRGITAKRQKMSALLRTFLLHATARVTHWERWLRV